MSNDENVVWLIILGTFLSLLKGTENVRVLVDKLNFLFEEINLSCSRIKKVQGFVNNSGKLNEMDSEKNKKRIQSIIHLGKQPGMY